MSGAHINKTCMGSLRNVPASMDRMNYAVSELEGPAQTHSGQAGRVQQMTVS